MTAAPSTSHTELLSFDEETYNIVDTITGAFEKLVRQVKCSVNAIEEIVGEGELKKVFDEFKANLESVLHHDMQECGKAEGLLEKLK